MTDRTWRSASAGTGTLAETPTAPLPIVAAQALRRLELALTPPPMTFPAASDATVAVYAIDGQPAPYSWSCTAGHSGDHTYAVLPFCRDDAKAHAATCLGAPLDVAKWEEVRAALGFRPGLMPRAFLGETATRLMVWSQMELNEIFERVGGTVSTRQVERSTSDGDDTWTATEIMLTVEVPEVGPVEIVTDIEDDPEHGYRTDIPVIAVARYRIATAHYRELAAARDFEGCEYVRDEMTDCLCQLKAAGRLDLVGGA